MVAPRSLVLKDGNGNCMRNDAGPNGMRRHVCEAMQDPICRPSRGHGKLSKRASVSDFVDVGEGGWVSVGFGLENVGKTLDFFFFFFSGIPFLGS